MTDSVIPDEMPHKALFVKTKFIFRDRNTIFLEYTMDHPDVTVSKFEENYIGLIVKGLRN